ncbi:VanZ family protein [Cytophagaceae bacterium ABcell3]|nr:VanZ family protein [Cytophagaceae bacterium ABcell3]
MFLRYNIFAIAWGILVLFLTLFPGQEMPDLSVWDMFSFDKFAHIFVFAVQVFLLIVGFTKQYTFDTLRKHPVRYAILFSFLLGFLIEFFQSLIPGRGFDYFDLVADFVGCVLGWVGFYFVYQFRSEYNE